MALLSDVILRDTRANQPAANTVGAGTLFGVTDEGNIVERSTGTVWEAYSPVAGGTGDVVGPASATDNALALFDGTTGKLLDAGANGTISGSLAIGPTPALTGAIRLANGQGVFARNAANTADLSAVEVRSDNTLHVGDGTSAATYVESIANIYLKAGASDYTITPTAIQPPTDGTTVLGHAGARFLYSHVSNSLRVGTDPAQSGAVRLANNQAITARNAANSADVEIVRVNASDQVTLTAPVLGTPSSGTLTNCTGLPTAGLVDDAVTLAKLQNATANDKLLGSGNSGSGANYAEITVGSGLAMTGTTLSASGSASGLTLVQQQTASSSANLSFTSWYSSSYDEYLIEFVNLVPATNAVTFLFRFSTNGGSSYDATNLYCWTSYNTITSTGGPSGFALGAATSSFNPFGGTSDTISNSATYGASASYRLFNPGSGTLYKQLLGQSMVYTGSVLVVGMKCGVYQNATAVNAFQVTASSGNIASGTIRVYGLAK